MTPCLNSFGEHIAAKRRLQPLVVEIRVFSLSAPRPVIAERKIFSRYGELEVGRDSSVGIETRYGLDGTGDRNRVGANSSKRAQNGPEAHPASYAMGTGSFPGLKRPGRGVDHSPHLRPRLKKE
jgi:hypothetical protein